jgi:hypothetical protein
MKDWRNGKEGISVRDEWYRCPAGGASHYDGIGGKSREQACRDETYRGAKWAEGMGNIEMFMSATRLTP